MDQILEPKDRDWLTGLKNKQTRIYAVYKTTTSYLGIHRD